LASSTSALQRIVGRALKTDWAGFRYAVGDGHLAHVHRFVDAPHHLDRAWRAGHDTGAQRGEIELGEIGVVANKPAWTQIWTQIAISNFLRGGITGIAIISLAVLWIFWWAH
jgi:hypothetical protein